MKKCFVIMPISVPKHNLEDYGNDENHFRSIYEHLFKPAIESIDYLPIPPSSSGSVLIHADIINNLVKADIVLCDMSAYNPNVFFELGIRIAINKPVCLVRDDLTKNIPFDTNIIHHEPYNHNIELSQVDSERAKIATHISTAIEKNKNTNPLWQYFGVPIIAHYDKSSLDEDEKLDYILGKLESLSKITFYEPENSFDKYKIFFEGINKILRRYDFLEQIDSYDISSNHISIKMKKPVSTYLFEEIQSFSDLLGLSIKIDY